MSNYFNVSAGAVTASKAVTLGGGTLAGSTHPLFVLILAGFTIFLLVRTPVSRIRRILLLAAVLLSASACSSTLPVSDDDVGGIHTIPSLEKNSSVIDGENERASTASRLNLSSDAGKAGLNQLLLGSTRLQSMQALLATGFSKPVCHADKTSIKGTGRLFLQEFCTVRPVDNISLEGLVVDAITFQILDDGLAKLEISLQSGDAMALTSQLDLRYEHVPSAERPFEWRLGDDHIRIVADPHASAADGVSGMALQMIDGRLEDKLPELFDYP